MAARVLIADDEKLIRQSLRDIFEYEGYEVEEAEDGEKALSLISAEKFAVVFCDIKMPKIDGIEVLEKSRLFTDIPFVMISGHGDIDIAVECIKKGAFDYLSKPLELNRILITLKNAVERETLRTKTVQLQKQIDKNYEIIGSSKVLIKLLEMADKVAETSAKVLIEGENGTGKELIARRIHEKSKFSTGPWITINCAAIPAELIESELFGHEKGAFTSAIKQRKGAFEQANGGTLFLDEIGDMGLAAQSKMLRALEDGKIMRVGGEKKIDTQVRIIAATNKNLQEEIAQGRFREDLYHRLGVIKLRVPPLRERLEDIPVLVTTFAKEIAQEMNKTQIKFTKEAIGKLQTLSWPGNIRELRNVVERLLILSERTVGLPEIEKYV